MLRELLLDLQLIQHHIMLDHFHRRLSVVERDLERGFAAPTFPIYDPANFPQNSLEGQIVVGVDKNLYCRSGGTWYSQTGVLALGNPPPNAIPGQIVIGSDHSLNWFIDGQWYGVAGVLASGNPPQYAVDGQLVIGNAGNICWHIGGKWYTAVGNVVYKTIQHYVILRQDTWHFKYSLDGVLLYETDWFNYCDPHVAQDQYEIDNGGSGGANYSWWEENAEYTGGIYLWADYYCRWWCKNVKFDGTMLNDMQGATPYTGGLSGSEWSIQNYPGGGKGAKFQPFGYQGAWIYMPYNPPSYTDSHTFELDISMYGVELDNRSGIIGWSFVQPHQWSPWRGVNPASLTYINTGIAPPIGYQSFHWSFNPGPGSWFADFNGEDSRLVSGPAVDTIMYATDLTWRHVLCEAQYIGHTNVSYPHLEEVVLA